MQLVRSVPFCELVMARAVEFTSARKYSDAAGESTNLYGGEGGVCHVMSPFVFVRA